MKSSSNDVVGRTVRVDYHSCSVCEFVDFWKKHYEGYDPREYQRFVDLGNPLSREHVLRAVTWKKGWDWKLERSEESFGRWTPNVKAWVSELKFLNTVRERGMKLESFDNELIRRRIFPRTIRMRTFVANVTRPLEWPILDSNVWRAYVFLVDAGQLGSRYTYENYVAYTGFFRRFCHDYRDSLASQEDELQVLKSVDESLFAFGQFLRDYGHKISSE